jgi:predicted phage terminase large subunit-like protein
VSAAARPLHPPDAGPTAKDWTPHDGPQTAFLELDVDEALYGGAAGGGKSESLLVDALYDYREPSYRGLLLRRTFDELKESLIDRSQELYRSLGARYNISDHQWRFPSGAKINFGHCEHENDKFKFKSKEYQFVGFDELTSFTEGQYRYISSRLRSSHGLRTRLRGGTNPGGAGHDWVLGRFAPWLNTDPSYTGRRAKAGEVLWAMTDPETGETKWVPPGTRYALSRTFIGAKVTDNPSLSEDYIAWLKSLDPLTRKQLEEGDWMARPSAGLFFKRGWFELIDAEPMTGLTVRFWDRAATEENDPSTGKPINDPDWTVGLKLNMSYSGQITICDIVRFRGNPGEVENTIKLTTELDGRNCHAWFSLDPGQAGKFEFASYAKLLMGYVVQSMPETGDKVTRAKPISAQAAAGNCRVVRGPWNLAFFQEVEAFPTAGVHDDQVDALSGAFAAVTQGAAPQLPSKIVRVRRTIRGD